MEKGSDKFWMTRALEVAVKGKSRTQPNPMVGCVIVHEGKIIAEGYHKAFGDAHAEVEAFNGLQNFNRLNEATAYVSLEPCSHHGKTPPCAEFLSKSEIGRVVTAMEDPNPQVMGTGHRILKENGISVLSGVLEEQAREMNRIFVHLQKSSLPYITLKWAQSKDGFIDPEENAAQGRGSIKISSEQSSQLVQTLRSHHNSILIGKITAKVDTPMLTSREEDGVDPIRIVIDPNCELDSSLYNIVICNSGTNQKSKAMHCEGLEEGIEKVLPKLRDMGVHSILVEGGAHTLNKFLESDLWNEAYVFESPINLGKGLCAPQIDISKFEKASIGEDTLYHRIR